MLFFPFLPYRTLFGRFDDDDVIDDDDDDDGGGGGGGGLPR